MLESIPADWRTVLAGRVDDQSLESLDAFVARQRAEFAVFPRAEDTFAALRLTPYRSVRAVILGQDPYHGPCEAHGRTSPDAAAAAVAGGYWVTASPGPLTDSPAPDGRGRSTASLAFITSFRERIMRRLGLLFVALLVAACGAAAPSPSPAPVSPAVTPTSAPTSSPTPTIEPTPAAASCGGTTTPQVIADMAAGAEPLNFTQQEFLDTWNTRWPDEDQALNRVESLGPLGEAFGYQSYGSFIPVTNQEVMFYSHVAPTGNAQAVALLIAPDTKETSPLGPSPLSSGLFIDTLAQIVSPEGTGLLNRLGVFLPMTSYDALAGVNTCVEFGSRYVRLVDVPAIDGHERVVYLFVRSRATTPSVVTPSPTPTPVPSPSLTGDLDAWQTFNDYVAVSATKVAAAVSALSEALNKGDANEIRAAIQTERTARLVFVDWLDAHPPRICYEQVWTLDRASAADDASSLAYLTKYLTSKSKADGDKFVALLEKSNEEGVRSNAAYDSVSCAP